MRTWNTRGISLFRLSLRKSIFFLHILTRYKKRFLEEEKHIKKTMHWGYIYGQDMKTLKLIELSGFVYEKKLFSEEKWL